MPTWVPALRGLDGVYKAITATYLETQNTVQTHVGTNDLKRSVNLDYGMREVYSLVNKAKFKFPQSKIVLSGVLRWTDGSWRRFGGLNDRYYWIAKILGVNLWIQTVVLRTGISSGTDYI